MADRTCSIDGCARSARTRGWCGMHYQRWLAHGSFELPEKKPRICTVPECGRDLALDKATGRGMCSKHYQRWRKHGDPNYVRPKKHKVAPCEIDDCEAVQIARGWCSKHYTRWQRHGSPTARMPGEVVNGKRVCPWCGEDTPLEKFGSAYCLECQADRKAARLASRPKLRVIATEKQCGICSEWFYADGKQSRYCGMLCASEAKAAADRLQNAQRRALALLAFEERLAPIEIFERDGWTCGLCGDAIDPWRRWPDALSASLDHILPVSLGGAHERSNVQAAHLSCNARKGARVA